MDEAARVDAARCARSAASGAIALVEHRLPQQPGDADARRAGPGQDEALLGQAPRPVPARPASTPATTTAAVPWMSSLKLGTRSR